MTTANDRQVGGDHYRQASAKVAGEQHWDRMWRLYGRGYFVGCITKYTERYHLKGGIQDLEKAKHYIEKLIELEKADQEPKEVGKGWTVSTAVLLSDIREPNAPPMEEGKEALAKATAGIVYNSNDGPPPSE